MIVNIHAAKTNLSKLIERAEAGEEVVIARAGKAGGALDGGAFQRGFRNGRVC